MMCEPGERDLAHAARRALADAEATGSRGEALIDAATDAVAALWAHIDRELIRAAVAAQARRQKPVLR